MPREEVTMSQLRTQTTVLAGHRIEISTPGLPEGTRVEVIVVPAATPMLAPRSALEIIESLQGHRLFQTAEEVRRHLEEERNAWDR
jgi:hypothetical protein